MKFKKIRKVAIHTRTVCDLCGKDTREALGVFEAGDVTIKATQGRDLPDSNRFGLITETFDFCIVCWTQRVRPAIEALGAKPIDFAGREQPTSTMPDDLE